MATTAASAPIPLPVDSCYVPKASLTHLPSNASVDKIIDILDRDGGVIIDDFVTSMQLDSVNCDVARYHEAEASQNSAISIVPKETILTPGLVGKSDTVAALCESPQLAGLRKKILTDEFVVSREGFADERCIDPLLSISLAFNVGPRAPRQRLHRDDNIHDTKHERFDIRKVSQFACLIAGCETTRENGATMVIPGSHRWDDERQPRIDEIAFAEMKPGAALIFLADLVTHHDIGAGHNATKAFRTVYGLFFCREHLRQEENQILAIPHSKVLSMSKEMQGLLGHKQPKSVLGIVHKKDPMADLANVLRLVAA
ncbi:hypothetical protein B0A55_06163 [Friedmanniomyces simplex]|uniref:Phytanoyl-CoA dioxygenase n=1 Tax=Friedmanniomyces simplex TaxID=329884 RepID=A0A4U0WZR2_9PEZI|nr:hypothetical protein B0A55_06163 [Friedmanniomyces simplex]